MIKRKTIAFTIIAVLLLISSTPVLADVAPPEPPSGTDPEPGNETTNVRMVSETVLININADSSLDDGNGKVTATFTMRNLGNTDEPMDVRFPLDQTTRWGGLCKDIFPQFSSITDLRVKVNDLFVSTQKTYQTITIPTVEEPHPTITIPCWENFPVLFPVGKDIVIQVTYTTEPYYFADASYIYSYILETGTGWKDTIGTADIIFQLPYELNDSNFYSCQPQDCMLSENKIQWHYEDFEPTSNISVSLLPPPLWEKIVLETKNTIKNPNDGEAWGRLAKAYKESIKERGGFRSAEGYQLSKEAYEKAIALLPNDADWENIVGSNREAWIDCVEQVQQVLDLNPNHEMMKEMIEYYGGFDGMIDFSGSQPDYLILTPQPTATVVPTEISIQATATLTAIPSPTIQVTKTENLSSVTTSTPTSMPIRAQTESNMPIFIGGAILLLVTVFLVVKFKKA